MLFLENIAVFLNHIQEKVPHVPSFVIPSRNSFLQDVWFFILCKDVVHASFSQAACYCMALVMRGRGFDPCFRQATHT